ncbi:MAG: Mth938-like domain-containing protein [Betaproteobacteria bacterium]
MKLKPAQTEGQNVFTAYGDGYVSVNAIRYTSNLIVLPQRLITEWTSASFETLSISDFELLAALENDIILFGTGNTIRFPRHELLQPIIKARKGLEVMDIQAACRTYNILISEGRTAVAALIFS